MAENSARFEEEGACDCVEGYDCEDTATLTSCGSCFCGICFRWSPPHRYETCQEEEEEEQEQEEVVKDDQNWLLKELKKVKALPEILVGLKWWKTCFVRRLKIYSGWNKKKRRMQFQYDPQSYALNFDDGKEKEGNGVYLDFSARYACPVGINKVHLGLGAQ